MVRLVAQIIVLRHGGFFHTAQPMVNFTGLQDTIKELENVPEDHPLPIIVYRKFSGLPAFKGPLVRAVRPGSGFDVMLLFKRSQLDVDMIDNLEYTLWTPSVDELSSLERAMAVSDELTRWLRGNTGWIRGPRPNVKLHDFMIGFRPKWARIPPSKGSV